jgi:hypothetical protein
VRHPICLIQLATPSLAVLFRISPRQPLAAPLAALLQDEQVTLVGQDIGKELRELLETYGLSRPGAAGSIIELAPASRAVSCLCTGVAGYAAALIGIRLHKTKSLQLSNWEAHQLQPDQRRYAATDAWVCWVSLEVLESAEAILACRAQRPEFFCHPQVLEGAAPSKHAAPTAAATPPAVPTPTPLPGAAVGLKLCKFFAAGQCSRGGSCRFLHAPG